MCCTLNLVVKIRGGKVERSVAWFPAVPRRRNELFPSLSSFHPPVRWSAISMVGYMNNVEEGVVPETVHGMLFSIVLAAFPTSPNLTFQAIKAGSVRERKES